MSIHEIESAIAELTSDELARFTVWFEQFRSDAWDQQIEGDLQAGRLDTLLSDVDAEIESGKAKPL